jgi:glycosyltransferase involved in cell wall biosynthesis
MMAGRLHYLENWLSKTSKNEVSVIIVHDKKDERTSIELKQLIERTNSNLVELYEDKFGGPGAARNFGLSRVKTEWVTFWDADDIPSLEATLTAIASVSPNITSVVTNYEVLDLATGMIQKMKMASDIVTLACQAGIWRYCFRTLRAKQSQFGESTMGEDQVFLAKLQLARSEIEFVSSTSYRYIRGHDYQLTKNPDKFVWLITSINEFIADYNKGLSKSHLSFSIGIRMSLTLLKNGSLSQKLTGLKSLLKIIFSSKIGLYCSFRIFLRIVLREAFNAKRR